MEGDSTLNDDGELQLLLLHLKWLTGDFRRAGQWPGGEKREAKEENLRMYDRNDAMMADGTLTNRCLYGRTHN